MAKNALPSAAARTFANPELLENILLHLSNEANTKDISRACKNDLQPQLSLFALQRVNRNFRDLITTSPSLRKNMFEPPSKRYDVSAQPAPPYARRFGLEAVEKRAVRLESSKRADTRAQSWCKIRLHAEGEVGIRLQGCTRHTRICREMKCEGKTWGDVLDWVWESMDHRDGDPLRDLME